MGHESFTPEVEVGIVAAFAGLWAFMFLCVMAGVAV